MPTAMFVAMVVLPAPPFWLMTEMTICVLPHLFKCGFV
jgi:hypothetical protein